MPLDDFFFVGVLYVWVGSKRLLPLLGRSVGDARDRTIRRVRKTGGRGRGRQSIGGGGRRWHRRRALPTAAHRRRRFRPPGIGSPSRGMTTAIEGRGMEGSHDRDRERRTATTLNMMPSGTGGARASMQIFDRMATFGIPAERMPTTRIVRETGLVVLRLRFFADLPP